MPHKTPEAFAGAVTSTEILVLPLSTGDGAGRMPGWCSYLPQLSESPDIEVLSGGINVKAHDAAGLWRQGHLLHFGFDLPPAEMNEAGRRLLVNSIHYIARFRQDRAILESPSPFAGGRARSRDSVRKFLTKADYPLDWFTSQFAAKVLPETEDREALGRWLDRHEGTLHPDESGAKLTVDPAVQKLDLRNDDPGFLAAVVEDGDEALLHRYAPRELLEVPAGERPAWLAKHREQIFFSEWGGYRWYLDGLAAERGVASADLRGPARADREP